MYGIRRGNEVSQFIHQTLSIYPNFCDPNATHSCGTFNISTTSTITYFATATSTNTYRPTSARGKFLIMDTFVKPNFRVKLMFLCMDISS